MSKKCRCRCKAKKILGWAVFFTVLSILVSIMLIISAVEPLRLGNFIVRVYEDITTTYGHSVSAMYAKLTVILSIVMLISFIITIALIYSYGTKMRKTLDSTEHEVDSLEEEKIEKEAEEAKMKKERKEKVRKFLKKRVDAVEEKVVESAEKTADTAATVVTVKVEKKADEINDFLKMLG